MSEARRQVTALVTAHIAPLMKTAGFRKRGLVFERKRGEVTQLVTIQLSSGGDGTFMVNIGLVFDAIKALRNGTGGVVIGGKVVDFSTRLATKRLPKVWTVTSASAGTQVAAALAKALRRLDSIDDAPSALDGLDSELAKGFHKVLRAQLKYTTGDKKGARADLAATAAEFSDRRGCSVEELAKRARLKLPR